MYNDSTPTITVFIHNNLVYTVKKQKERREAGTGTELILQAHAVSFHFVRWVGVLSVIGQNKLVCDWSE
jgi:hypothetical protein